MKNYKMLRWRKEAIEKLKEINTQREVEIEELTERKEEMEFHMYKDINNLLLSSKEGFEKELKKIKESYDFNYLNREIEDRIYEINSSEVLVSFTIGGLTIENKFLRRYNPINQSSTILEITKAYGQINDRVYQIQMPYKGHTKITNLNEDKNQVDKETIRSIREEILPQIFEDNIKYDLEVKNS